MKYTSALTKPSQVASLGLSHKDRRLIKYLFTLSRKLKNYFEYSDKADLAEMDLLFVNLENEQAMQFYADHPSAEPIFLYPRRAGDETPTPELPQYPNVHILSTPIKLVELNDVLENMLSAPKTNTKPVPVLHKKPSSVSPVLHKKSSPDLQRKKNCFKILVVDDSSPVRKYLEEKLPFLMAEIHQNLDFDIQFAASGREAVGKIKEARGAFDMVFLDIMMDDIDGYKICKWIKKVKRSINVVMLTSKSSPFDRLRGNLCGCDNYLSKPPKDDDLKKVILQHRKFEQVHYYTKPHRKARQNQILMN